MYLINSIPGEVTEETAEKIAEKVSLLQRYLPKLQILGIKILFAVIMFLIGHKIILTIQKVFKKTLARLNIDMTAGQFFSSVLNAILHILLVFIIAAQLGFSTSTIIAVLGSATLAIGLALQDSLAHFAGGLLILFMHPFRVGDYIICSSGEGTVMAIGLVYTTIATPDNRSISVPNGTLASDNVTNCSAFPFRRVDLFVSIGYDEDIKKAKDVLYSVYSDHPDISKEHEINVFVSELGESTIVLGGQGYVERSKYLRTKWDLTEGIRLAFDEAGIEIPFAQVDVHIR
ncbi:MAG TPA: mechanosensitive ion channel protein [Lachnospiraceae bacterium]|nr:mechanosensitive ion channel protein [Lachnospiraceae bacterium]